MIHRVADEGEYNNTRNNSNDNEMSSCNSNNTNNDSSDNHIGTTTPLRCTRRS